MNSVIKDSNTVIVRVKVLPGGKTPEKKTEGAAGWDCYCRLSDKAVDLNSPIYLQNGVAEKIPLGFALEMPTGVSASIVARSSTFLNTDILVHHATIDSDYRGEVNALVKVMDLTTMVGAFSYLQKNQIKDGQRLVQMVFNVPNVKLAKVDELSETKRGDGGFGSTGK